MSIGLGLLDSVFAGEKGLAATLTKNFGGTATLIYDIVASEYDESTGKTNPVVSERQTIAFAQETLKSFVEVFVGGVQAKSGSIVGLVAASDLEYTIANHHTRLVWQNKTWTIVSHEPFSSGNETAMIRILAQ